MAHITIPDDEAVSTHVVTSSSTGPFNLGYPVTNAEDIRASVDHVELNANDFVFTSTDTRDGGYQAGYITLAVAVANCTVRTWRNVPAYRTSDFATGPFDVVGNNSALDRLTAQVSDLKRDQKRSVRVAPDAAALDPVSATASGYLYIDEGDAVLVSTLAGGVPVSAFMDDVILAEGGSEHAALVNSCYVMDDVPALRLASWTADDAPPAIVVKKDFGDSGDGGVFVRDTGVVADNGGTRVRTAAPNYVGYRRVGVDGVFKVKHFGVKAGFGANATTNTTGLQDAFNAAAAVGGEVVLLEGIQQINAVVSRANSAPFTVRGYGMGLGPGGTQEGGSRILGLHTTGDILSVTGLQGFTFRDFHITSTGAGSRSSGRGLYIGGVGTAFNAQSRVSNVGTLGMYDGIEFYMATAQIVEGVWQDAWSHHAGRITTLTNYEGGGGFWSRCIFFGDADGATTQSAGMYLEPGIYTNFESCGWVGSQVACEIATTQAPASTVTFNNCDFEESAQKSIWAHHSGSNTFAKLGIHGCRFSNIGTGLADSHDVGETLDAHIQVDSGLVTGVPWIRDIDVRNNRVFSFAKKPGFAAFNFQGGRNVACCGNLMNNNGNTAHYAIFVGSQCDGVVEVLDNPITGYHPNKYGVTANTLIRDHHGLTFAGMPAAAKNGSQIMCTDGTAGAPLTGAGSGSLAVRVNSTWKGL